MAFLDLAAANDARGYSQFARESVRAAPANSNGGRGLRVSQEFTDCRQQCVGVIRLGEQSVKICFPRRRRSIQHFRVPRYENCRQARPDCLKQSRQFNTVDLWHVNVGDHAVDLAETGCLEQLRGRSKQTYGVTRGFQKILERSENTGVIVNHCYECVCGVMGHGCFVRIAD